LTDGAKEDGRGEDPPGVEARRGQLQEGKTTFHSNGKWVGDMFREVELVGHKETGLAIHCLVTSLERKGDLEKSYNTRDVGENPRSSPGKRSKKKG